MLFTPSETKVVIVGGGTMGADVAAVCARGVVRFRYWSLLPSAAHFYRITLPTP
jgi:3-hydroxyacyl-CoA dehydrogenase